MSAQAAAERSLTKRQQELAQVAMEINEARGEKEGIEQLAPELAATCGEAPCTAAARAPTASAPTASSLACTAAKQSTSTESISASAGLCGRDRQSNE